MDIKKLISDTLKMVDLDESLLQRDPFTLSSGEKRKLAIASILIYNPKIILMDEPTIGLDYKSRENLIKIIRNLKTEYKKTIIIVSNDVDLIHKISDYIYILKEGNLLLSGNKYDVFKNTKLLRENNINIPKLIEFSDYVLINKRIKIGYRDEINDLIKDIYRYAK
ncbi:MAG: energy-coupling factor ABC transporter ATP-binding protein [Bacilli bacterium]